MVLSHARTCDRYPTAHLLAAKARNEQLEQPEEAEETAETDELRLAPAWLAISRVPVWALLWVTLLENQSAMAWAIASEMMC